MLKEKVTFVMPALMLGVSVYAAAETAPAAVNAKEVSPDYTVRLINVGRQETLRDVNAKISRAN